MTRMASATTRDSSKRPIQWAFPAAETEPIFLRRRILVEAAARRVARGFKGVSGGRPSSSYAGRLARRKTIPMVHDRLNQARPDTGRD